MSSVDETAHFGLGSNKNISSLEILWPDGKYQIIKDITGNQTISLDYKNANLIDSAKLFFPLTAKNNANLLFKEVSEDLDIDLIHREKDIVDYNIQRILPHKLSQNGPCLVVGDINGDDLEDLIVGSSSTFSPIIHLQKSNGSFIKIPLFKDKDNLKYEEESMALFDLDNDGDLDLYLVSGSNEFAKGEKYYEDRLFLNDGEGNFTLTNDRMPRVSSSGSVVRTVDFDNDGYLDLFVGGRTPMGEYPIPDKSFLLKNNKGYLEI